MSRRSSPPSSDVRPQEGISAEGMEAAAWAMHAAAMSGVDPMAHAGSYADAYGLPADTQASTSSNGNRGRDLDESNVYVARLPANFTLEKFHELMSRYGTVMSARLLEGDRWQNKGVKGVGFARMSRPDEAVKAIEALNALRLPGCSDNLQARYAYKKTKDQPPTAVIPAYPQSMPWPDPASMAAMQFAVYGMAGYGAGQPGAHSHGAGAHGASAAASAAAGAAGPSHQAAGEYAAWMAQMAHYYQYGEYYNAAAGSAWNGVQANPSSWDGGPDGSSGSLNPFGRDGGHDGSSGSHNPSGQGGGPSGSSGSGNPSGRDGRLDGSSGSRNPSGRDGGTNGSSGSRTMRHAAGGEAAGSHRDNRRRSSPSPDRRDRKKPRRSDESRRGHRSRSTSADKPNRLAHAGSSRRDRKPERDDGTSSRGRSSRRDSKEGASSSSKIGSPSSATKMASRKSPAESKDTAHVKRGPKSDMTSRAEPKTKPMNKEKVAQSPSKSRHSPGDTRNDAGPSGSLQ